MSKFNLDKEKIDLVYLWVDDQDFNWYNKKTYWQNKLNLNSNIENATASCRFQNHNELKYSLRSVEKFAPWINNIFIVTDNQKPDWLDTNNPKIKIIDHKDFIEEEYLPCFNAVALEFHLHKIPGLSEYFLYANDDMFFGHTVKKTDFFTKNGKIIERTNKLNYTKSQLEDSENFVETIPVHFNKAVFYSNAMMYKKFGIIPNYIDIHNITAYKKSLIKECCNIFSEEVHNTCKQKFREGISLQRLIFSYYAYYKKELINKKSHSINNQSKILDLPKYHPLRLFKKLDYITLHLGKYYTPHSPECIIKEKPLLFCINDTISSRKRHHELFQKMINQYFPEISSFEKPQQIHICLAANEAYSQHCAAAILSIIENASKNVHLNFYLLYANISDKSKDKISKISTTKNSNIKFIKINPEIFKDCPIPKNLHFSIETYFRLKIPSLFKNLDKLLYIDCDTTTLGDISELWNIDISDFCAAACQDINDVNHLTDIMKNAPYFNAGILLVNCKKWREENIEEKCFEFIHNNSNKIIWVDQDVLNCVLINKIKFFDQSWNLEYNPSSDRISYLYKDNEIKLIHFISKHKPWNSSIKNKYAKYYYKYAFKTPWKLKTIANFIRIKIQFINMLVSDHKIAKKLALECKGNRVVLWGASIYLKNLIKFHHINTKEIIGIIDRDPGKTGKKIGRYKIYHPNSLELLKPNKIVSSVINHPKMEEFIKKELEQRKLDIQIDTSLFTK